MGTQEPLKKISKGTDLRELGQSGEEKEVNGILCLHETVRDRSLSEKKERQVTLSG